jgi:hypothetical protein
MQLRTSQLPQELWVATTLGALRGAARASFTRIHGDAPLNNWTFEQFQLALTSLVPNHSQQVLDTLSQRGLKAKLSKCDFFKAELKFLGHIVSAKGIQRDPAKVAVVLDWPTPKTVYDVRSFLELANYFRKFIRGYAAISAPLTDLLKGVNKQEKKGRLIHLGKLPLAETQKLQQQFLLRWTETCQHAYTTLKNALTSAPVLVMPDFEKYFEVVTDACEIPRAIGGVLLQDAHPVAFYSRKLSGTELN